MNGYIGGVVGRTDSAGDLQVRLPANTAISASLLGTTALRSGTFSLTTDAPGAVMQVGAQCLGISDLPVVKLGLKSLGDNGLPTGMIASLPLQGEASSVTVATDPKVLGLRTAYFASGSSGLAIVNATKFSTPRIMGQLELTGNSTDLAVVFASSTAVVAANAGGFTSSTCRTRLLRECGGRRTSRRRRSRSSTGSPMSRLEAHSSHMMSSRVRS